MDKMFDFFNELFTKVEALKKKMRGYVVDKTRLEAFKRGYFALVAAFTEYDSTLDAKAEIDPILGTTLCVSFTADILSLTNVAALRDFLQDADTFEVVPLKKWKVEIGITFQNFFQPIFLLPDEETALLQTLLSDDFKA